MKNSSFSILLVAGMLSASISAQADDEITRARTPDGVAYATGAVTVSDLQELAAEKSEYKLWVTTAAKKSGAFLSDAQVKILDARKKVVLDTTVIGPWLLVDLTPGTYV